MDDRSRSLDILRQARDLLAQRLTEKILESEEGLLDDARGDSYLGDIDSIYEQFGMKLMHLNQLINNLPLETEAPQPPSPIFTDDAGRGSATTDSAVVDEVFTSHPAALTGPLIVSRPRLPAPRAMEEVDVATPSFSVFAGQIRSAELREAARTLSILLEISEARGMQCVRIFHRRWEEEETFILKPLQLRSEVINSGYNSALMLLAECFGLVGIEAIGVLQTLRTRFIERNEP